MATAEHGLLGSYKAKMAFALAGMALVPIALVFVLVLAGRATVDHFFELSKWIFITVGFGGVLPTILGRAAEGYAEKRDSPPQSIVAGSIGKIDTMRPPPPPEPLEEKLTPLPGWRDDEDSTP